LSHSQSTARTLIAEGKHARNTEEWTHTSARDAASPADSKQQTAAATIIHDDLNRQ